MIEPLQSDAALLADIEVCRAAGETGAAGGTGGRVAAGDGDAASTSETPTTAPLHIWWLGQSGFLVQHRGRHLLLDPYLSDSLTRKYADTDKPHVRMTRRCIDPATLGLVDVLTSSHNHTDHLDAESISPILAANPKLRILAGKANRAFAADRLGVAPDRLDALDAGESWTGCGFILRAVPAAHETLERDEAGHHRFLGFVIEAGPWRIYHSGDTVAFDGQVAAVQAALSGPPLDLALLPINGRAAERRVAGNLDGPEAARLAKELGARTAVPCHYEMFAFNTASPEAFTAEAASIGQPVRVLRCGERLTLV